MTMCASFECDVEQDAGDDRARIAEEARPSALNGAADARGHEHRGEQRDAARAEQREHGREREPVDVRPVDHGPSPTVAVAAATSA